MIRGCLFGLLITALLLGVFVGLFVWLATEDHDPDLLLWSVAGLVVLVVGVRLLAE